MRLALLVLVAVAALVVWRRRRTDSAHVVVGWPDGEELGLAEGAPERERLVTLAERTLG